MQRYTNPLPPRFRTSHRTSSDFPAVEILLDIFGTLLPSTGNSESGRAKRIRFIQDVLRPFPSKEELTKNMGDMQSDQWEVTSRKIIDKLADDDVSLYVKELLCCDISS